MTRFSLSSDLHLEFHRDKMDLIRDKIINSGADFHILAGDVIGNMKEATEFASSIPNAIFIPGNHEYYDRTNAVDEDYLLIEKNGIQIFAGTLWTDYNKSDPFTERIVYRGLNDSFWIKDYSVERIKKINKVHYHAIFDFRPDLVITHHAPSYQSVAEKYRGDWFMNGGFVNDYDNQILDSNIKVWCHGHTHTRMNYMIGNTRVICNPLGYPRENREEWNPVVFKM